MRLADLTIAIRNLTRRPGFACTAILLLALGSGANAAVFSVVRGVLLKPLPFERPEELVDFWPGWFVSNEEIAYWRERAPYLASISGISPGWMMALVADGVEPLKVTAGRVGDNFFSTLGVRTVLGRTLQPGDSSRDRSRVAVISSELHERHFGSDPRILGRSIRLDNVVHEIVGVMPRGFEFMEPGTDVWAPLVFDPTSPQHRASFNRAVARLAPGVTAERASQELQALIPAMHRDLAKTGQWGRGIHVRLLQDSVANDVRLTLLILLGAVGMVLLMAAVNLGTLAMGRSIARAREMAVRTALGASRGRLIRQLIVEHIVLAAAGAIAGLLLAWTALPILARAIPPEMPRQSAIALDLTVFGLVFAASVGVSALLALVPASVAARPELQPLLRQQHGGETPARRRTMGTLVAVQIALAVILGIGASLLLRSLWNLQRVDPGFDAARVLTFRLQTTSKYNALGPGLPYFEQVVERLRALPGVTHVGSIQHPPMTGYNWTSEVHPVERPPQPGEAPARAVWRIIAWDYFPAMGIRMVAGRAFSAQDHLKSVPVAIVNETFARREYGNASNAIGRRMVNTAGRGADTVEIVGVIADVRYLSLDSPPDSEIYRPLAQTFMFPMAFAVRTDGDPASLAAAVRRLALEVDGTIPVAEMQPLSSLIAGSLGKPRLLAMLLSVFAGVGLALSLVGVYGVVAYRVRQQERELGIRLALGATPASIRQRVLRHGAGYAALGVVLGLPVALGLAGLLQAALFGIAPRDPAIFTGLPIAVVLATLAACVLPAHRAARVDPVQTMKSE
jgi:putative ABC transport system permease protein